MNNQTVQLRSVGDLEKNRIKFYIDSYQRGYRWTENEVADLLDDIMEFNQKHYSEQDVFYCLQPIIVTQADEVDSWKVIDGQQRLTTLYLIAVYLKGVFKNLTPYDPYIIAYNNKEKLTECIKHVSAYADMCLWNDEIYSKLYTNYGDDIDCHYIINAFNYICKCLDEIRNDPTQIQALNDFNVTFKTKTKVIWYDLHAQSINDETSSFRKINMGKIPLTNAELIKALLLREDKDDKDELSNYKKNIAVFWNKIEQELSDNRFWKFLTNANDDDDDDDGYPNRIDFLFDVISKNMNENWKNSTNPEERKYTVERSSNKKYFSFHVFSNYISLLDDDDTYVKKIWEEVEEYFRMFKDWYTRKDWYHLIGYIVSISGNKYLDAVCNISQMYRNHVKGKKTAFVKSLQSQINSSIRKKGKTNSPFTSVEDLKTYLENDFTYTSKPKEINNILLLYNVASTEMIKNEYTRFPFYAYKDSEIQWSIEHINPQKEDTPKNTAERLEWFEKLYESVDEISESASDSESSKKAIKELKNNITKAHEQIEKDKNIKAEDFSVLYEKVIDILDEDQGTDHTLSNLVLLDKGRNSCFSNAIFPVKRRLLIEEYKNSDVFIPICTRNVFFKAFPESKELLKWNRNDKKNYFDNIVNTISSYLGLKEETDNE